ncbi:MAG: metallopeptidase family protein [Dehalococcoidales bacterium]|nr:MAG: metallopeptidase family protein [Dehalococcoidales bacterium]
MDRIRFEELVARAVETLPEQFLERMENVVVVVEDRPTRAQLAKAGAGRSYTLLGLYEGLPLTRRGRHYNLVVPDKITIFQRPIESRCRNDDEITAEVQRVVQHEIAHHFGVDEATMRQIEREKYRRRRR